MREAEALSRAHPSGRRQLVVPKGVRVMLRFGLMAQCASTSNACLANRRLPQATAIFIRRCGPAAMIAPLKPPLRIPPDGHHRGRVQMVSLDLRGRAGEKIEEGRHVGLDFYDLLIEARYTSGRVPFATGL